MLERDLLFNQLVGLAANTAVEVLFFLAGFAQAISFLQSCNSSPSFFNVITHTLKRIIKLEFFYAINLLVIVYVFRSLGDGPTWYFFDKLMAPCDKGIWSNLLFVNNFVNNFGSKEDMCLPWTWFLAVYTQLSLITPLLVYLMTRIMMICYPAIILLGLVSLAITGIQVWVLDCGVNSSYDITYWSNVYTKPW
jgi:hypothetical protein